MRGWKYSQNRKVHQRNINKYVRAMNKNIATDDLWRGRFVVKQFESQWYSYDDGSGNYLIVGLAFIDKKTNKQYHVFHMANEWCAWGGSKIWETMNWFITEYIDVWRTEGQKVLRADTTNYIKMPIPAINKNWF